MAFKSETRPLCRYCGKPIGKRTETIFFGKGEGGGPVEARPEKPRSKAEVQALTNFAVVSVHWYTKWVDDVEVRDYITYATVWDGVSYDDEFFCTQQHARWFGYAAVRGGQVMEAYREALARQSS